MTAPLHIANPRVGVANGLGAYLFWGVVAVWYFKQVHHVQAYEVIGYRIVGSVICLLALLSLTGGLAELKRLLTSKRLLAWLTLTAVLVSANWLIFIWAVGNNLVVESALGYFITPLFQVALGVIVLGERMRRLQIVAFALAAIAMLVQVVWLGQVPWIALGLAVTFSLYGLFRRQLSLQAVPALTAECIVLLPVGIAFVLWPMRHGTLVSHDAYTWVILALAGLVTAIPLVMFGIAARNLKLSTIGFLQYIGPTCQFLMAILVYGETVNTIKLLSLSMIWVALVVFSIDAIRAKNAAVT
jgi:chloramphenicol-sensitive protein RarD